MPAATFRWLVVEVDRAGTYWDLLLSESPIEAFRFAEAVQEPRRNVVGVGDANDPERGWLDEDSEIERWLGSLTDSEFCGVVARYTGVNFLDGKYEDGRLVRDEATDALYDALYRKAVAHGD